ncbi:expressed unknown protein [Seminavis robusta]|uniref:Uncharacterized protein n=1 Tax=Seminavis robusta TaxID=568900 RepID=A0A9N8HNE3_9STRA|nr:expressed unknown protein [Seminavis robusta]|eukprot:Sro1077_g238570.1 n/a (267) ;mRNA; f:9955-10755
MSIRVPFFLGILAVSSVDGFNMDAGVFANKTVHQLEQMYIDDCAVDTSPHGYYGAFLQPCEFQFRQSNVAEFDDKDACSDKTSTLVAKPIPMNWFFNSTFLDEDGWSSDDFPSGEDLLLWPDQCVGVTPRCYSVNDEAIHETLTRIFSSGGIPEDATHVRVDCRSDAMALSRAIDAFADNIDKLDFDLERVATIVVAWLVTVFLVALVLAMWCMYACLRLCSCFRGGATCKHHPETTHVLRRSEYEVIEEGTEKEGLLGGEEQLRS